MASRKPSSTQRTFLLGLETPQSVSIAIHRLTTEISPLELISSPLPPMLPVLQTQTPPAPPVPGLLPRCPASPVLIPDLLIAGNPADGSRWVMWSVEPSLWYSRLKDALIPLMNEPEDESAAFPETSREPLFPFCRGIPLGVTGAAYPGSGLPSISDFINPGWRALKLVCLSVEYLTDRPWYMSCAWYPLWSRRLRRAPEQANNNK